MHRPSSVTPWEVREPTRPRNRNSQKQLSWARLGNASDRSEFPDEENRKMAKWKKGLRALLIANPGSGKALDKALQIKLVTRYLAEYGLVPDVAVAAPKKEATPIARKAVKDGYNLIIAMGGDGTISAVIRGIAGSKARLGIIVAGTMNDIGKSLGIPIDPKEACALIASGHTRKLDLGQVTSKKKKKFYFFMVAAIGLHATLDPMFKNVPKGNLSSLSEVVTTFLKYKTNPKVFLTLDDESKVEVETMGVTVANLPLVGMNSLVAPDASTDDGLLDISIYPNFSKAELLSYFASTMNEGIREDGKLQRYRVRKVKVRTSPKMDVTADGVRLGKGTVRIKVCPGALRVLAPAPGAGVEIARSGANDQLPAPLSGPRAPRILSTLNSSPRIDPIRIANS
jgi:diacylglycerol kinase (ATP)